MDGATVAAIELVALMLKSTTPAEEVHAAKVQSARCFEVGASIVGAELYDVAWNRCRACGNGRGECGGDGIGQYNDKGDDAGGRTSRGEPTSGAFNYFADVGLEARLDQLC